MVSSMGTRLAPGISLSLPFSTLHTTTVTRRRQQEARRITTPPPQPRAFSHTPHRELKPPRGGRKDHRSNKPDSEQPDTAEQERLQAVNQILAFPKVWLVDRHTQRLSGPMSSSDALARINPALQQLKVASPDSGPDGLPVLRIEDLKAAREREERLARGRRNGDAASAAGRKEKRIKVLELGWGIAQNDLAHKSKQMARFLNAGHRVEVAFLRRKGAKVVDAADRERLVAHVRSLLGEVGGREAKRPHGDSSGKMVLFVEAVPRPGKSPGKHTEESGLGSKGEDVVEDVDEVDEARGERVSG